MKTKIDNLNHMPQLDGLRALAVIAVLLHHFLQLPHLDDFALGGVKLFFVLSGFLITGILLKSRDIREEHQQSWFFSIRQFYIRRFLRIFPLYYFVIAVAFILNLEPVRQILPWLLTYTLNFYMSMQGWFVDHFAHFWTLAVEEQFYIVWPWFILFTPRKWLVPATVSFILLGPIYRAYEIFIGLNGVASYIFPLASLDSLGMGSLLAILAHHAPSLTPLERGLRRFALPVGLPISLYLLIFPNSKLYAIFFDPAQALFFIWLVYSAAQGFKGWVGAVLESGPFTYIGKISYGVYVYHPFMLGLCRFIFEKAGWIYPENIWIQTALQSMATLVISSLSWYLMERPINNLKRYFSYVPKSEKNPHKGNLQPSFISAAN